MSTPNPVIDNLVAQITTTTGVIQSAVTAFEGVAARIQAAVDAALAGGATQEQLAPVQTEIDSLKNSTDALAKAIAA
jgi:hypothetical protein